MINLMLQSWGALNRKVLHNFLFKLHHSHVLAMPPMHQRRQRTFGKSLGMRININLGLYILHGKS